MTDYLPDTPSLARCYCPTCEPHADPLAEILDVRWCERHAPAHGGADDDAVASAAFLSGSAEAGGDENRRWCQLLHGAGLERARSSTRPGRRHRRAASRTPRPVADDLDP